MTPHLIIELAKIYVHNPVDGFAREPVHALMRRVMTFTSTDPDAPRAKKQLKIRPNNGQTHLNISRCQVALSSTQTAELVKDMDPAFFTTDELHETPTQVRDRQEGFVVGEPETIQRVQSVETGLMREHAAQVAEISKGLEYHTVKQSFLTIRELVILPEEAH